LPLVKPKQTSSPFWGKARVGSKVVPLQIFEYVTDLADIKNWDSSFREILSDELVAKNEEAIRTAFGLLQDFARKEKKSNLVDRALETCIILKTEISLSSDSILCLFLRDLVKHSVISLDECEKKYGKQICVLITGLNKISQLDTKKYSSNTENFIKLLLTISDDTRVILIRIAERLFEMRHLEEHPPEQRSSLTGETSLLYIPLTHRIGLYNMKTEMEDLVMRAECPDIYENISRKIIETRKDRDKYISDFIKPIREQLAESGYECEIKGRVKSIPSIYRKMKVQKVTLKMSMISLRSASSLKIQSRMKRPIAGRSIRS
jgi:guanosine-3',5'-bis(diphosphate) 3'-pyrophosphohydrolase